MTDNTEVKNGNYNSGKKCPTYCDFCDWLGSWKNCFIYKELKKQKARWGNEVKKSKTKGDYRIYRRNKKRGGEMKLRKAKQKEIIEFIKRQLERDNYEVTVSLHQRAILENIYPFSWNVFCKEKKINPKILMDKHEISVRRVKSNGRC